MKLFKSTKDHYILSNTGDYKTSVEEGLTKEEKDEYGEDTTDYVNEIIMDEYVELINNFQRTTTNGLIAIADIGLWNGRRVGYKLIPTLNLSAIFTNYHADNSEFYASDEDVYFELSHHDGVHYGMIREFRAGISEGQRNTFLNNLYLGNATEYEIKRLTKSIRPYFAKAYGWKKVSHAV